MYRFWNCKVRPWPFDVQVFIFTPKVFANSAQGLLRNPGKPAAWKNIRNPEGFANNAASKDQTKSH